MHHFTAHRLTILRRRWGSRQAVCQALRERAPWTGEDELTLVYGRFNGRDRLARERRIVVAATAPGQRPQRMAAFVTRPAVAGKQRPVLVVSTRLAGCH